MEKKAIVRLEKASESDRLCRCCSKEATVFVELGQDFNHFIQTSTTYLCDEHTNELREQLESIK